MLSGPATERIITCALLLYRHSFVFMSRELEWCVVSARSRSWSEPLWDKQVIKPVYREALDKWKGNIPRETLEELSNNDMKLAAALRHFGYDPLI